MRWVLSPKFGGGGNKTIKSADEIPLYAARSED